jgi:SAM-dependent methyltransferase
VPDPSTWVVRFAGLAPRALSVLDVACGSGRHTRLFLERGHKVTATDADVSGLDDLRGHDRLTLIERDLEDGSAWPFATASFGAVVVTNYLHRPLLGVLVASVAPDGVLLYETFAAGNEAFGKPSRPDFLLQPGELIEAVRGTLQVVAYEHGHETAPRPAVRQRICAVNQTAPVALREGA